MEAVWGRMEVVGKCSADDGCGLRAIPAGDSKRGHAPVSLASGCPSPPTPHRSLCASVSPAGHSPLCTAMTGRWCCVKLLSRGEESWGDGLLKGDLSISVFFTVGEMPGESRVQRQDLPWDPRSHGCCHLSAMLGELIPGTGGTAESG